MADKAKKPRFILEWEQEHLPERNVKRIATGNDKAVQGIKDLLAGEQWFDEEKQEADAKPQGEGFYEDYLVDAVEAFVREHGDLDAFVAGLTPGIEEEFKCEEGTLKIFRDR